MRANNREGEELEMKEKKQSINQKDDTMQLKYYEQTELDDIQDLQRALQNLQISFIPIAKDLAKRQRLWWNRALNDRNLNSNDGEYIVKNGMIEFRAISKET